MVLSLLLFGLLVCAEDTVTVESITEQPEKYTFVNKSELVLLQNKGLVYYNNEAFTGISVAYYNENKVAERVTYINGKKHGFYRKWFDTGVLSFEAQYINGKQDGLSQSWWRNGILRSESIYENGIANGIQRQWYKTGAKFKELNIVNGKEEGVQKAWRENGKIFNNYEAKNGRIFGLKRANLCYELEEEIVQYQEL